jgi:hypothetical protein
LIYINNFEKILLADCTRPTKNTPCFGLRKGLIKEPDRKIKAKIFADWQVLYRKSPDKKMG